MAQVKKDATVFPDVAINRSRYHIARQQWIHDLACLVIDQTCAFTTQRLGQEERWLPRPSLSPGLFRK